MRLVSLELSGFRAFASRQFFDLDADAVIVVGANGHGKTSLFDGILWALCGRIPRLSDASPVVLSKFSDTGEARARLSLKLQGGERTCTVTRMCDGQDSQLTLECGGEFLQGPAAKGRLLELLWPEAAAAADSDAALSAVLTRSVYLQQDLVREFVDAASDEHCFSVVSELVGAGQVNDLKAELEKSKAAWTRATNSLQDELRPLRNQLALLDSQLLEIKNRLSRSSQVAADSEWFDWCERVSTLDPTATLPSQMTRDAGPAIDAAMRMLDNRRRATERRLDLLKTLARELQHLAEQPVPDLDRLRAAAETLEYDVQELRVQVRAEQARVAEMRRAQAALVEKKEQLRALASLALELLDGPCPVCAQQHNQSATRRHLETILKESGSTGRAQGTSDVLTGMLAALARKESESSATELALGAKLQLQRQREAALQTAARRFDELGLVIDENVDRAQTVAAAARSAEAELALLTDLQKRGELLSLQLTQASDVAKKGEIEREIESLRATLKDKDAGVKHRTTSGELGQSIIDALRETTSTVVSKRLEQLNPLLHAVYSRIDPHPAFRAVRLLSEMVRGRGCLYKVVQDPVSQVESDDPRTVLSSSQMNALAVSVFLSLNLGIARPPLSALVLDDPLQSLDDINLLGLIDLLRRTKDLRQLCLSTHDARFAKLLAHKLRPGAEGQRSVMIELDGWDRTGPRVTTTDLRRDPGPLRLFAS
jgi:exonuclease SbcC